MDDRQYTLMFDFFLDILVTPYFIKFVYSIITHDDNRENVFSHYFYLKFMTHMSKEIK